LPLCMGDTTTYGKIEWGFMWRSFSLCPT
jgi:hypothetical protein